ncbi:MAG: YihY/virulence factor BrkB family protein [Bacteroidetes bacterium]|nr:YihY/virulence factor BrkB family protein [Bacteroidota bacterium]
MSRFKLLRLLNNIISANRLRRFLDFLSYYFGGLFRSFDNHHIFLYAAGIAFSVFISMIPLVLLLFYVLGNIINVETVEGQVNQLIDTVIPYPDFATYTKSFILNRIPDVIQFKSIAGYLGTFGLLFTATWLFSGLRTVLNFIFGVREEKNVLVAFLRDIVGVFIVIVFVLLSTFILPSVNILLEFADQLEFLAFFRVNQLTDFLFSVISLLIIYGIFFFSYYLIPYENLQKRVPLVAALWATVLWEAARSLFGYYVFDFLLHNKIYGAFILIAVVAFWIFYSSVLFIIGAEIGRLYRDRIRINGNSDVESETTP